MPSFPLTWPAGVAFFPEKVKVRRQRAQAAFENEFTLQRQVQDWGNKRWAIEVSMQPMIRDDAATFQSWLDSLNGLEGTFNFDLDPWVRGTAPGVKVFKLTVPDDEFDADLSVEFGFSFSAMEDV